MQTFGIDEARLAIMITTSQFAAEVQYFEFTKQKELEMDEQ